MLIIATIQNKSYSVDVGFAAFGTTRPLPLEEGVVVPCIPGLEARNVKQTLPQGSTNQSVWVFQTRNAHSKQWEAGYCFSEIEWLPQDFDSMNLQLCVDPKTWTQMTLLVTKLILKDDEVEGILVLANPVVQQRVGGGEAEMLGFFGSESDRVAALEKYFGIVYTQEEVNGIVGRVTELKAQA
jgi:arylamine N-acetyltransferase